MDVSLNHERRRWRGANPGVLIFWLLLLAGSIGIAERYIPPFQSPDEDVHLMRAAMLAHGQVLLQRRDGTTRDSGEVDTGFVALATDLANMTTQTRAVVEPPAGERVAQLGGLRWSGDNQTVQAAGTGYYAPVIYVPHAIGLWLGKQLDLTVLDSYRLTRALVIAAVLALLFYAWSIATPSALMLMLVATPLALFQWLSPTIDGLCNALLLLMLAFWVRLVPDSGAFARTVPRHYEYLFYGTVFILCTSRTNLLPILLVPLLLLVRAFSWRRLTEQLILAAATLGWTAFAALSSGDRRLQRAYSNGEILLQYLMHPFELVRAIAATISNPSLLKGYFHSFSGVLGWLNAPVAMDRVLIVSALLAIAFVVALRQADWQQHSNTRLWACAVALASTLLIFVALAVTYNDYPTPYIIGIQGRYFVAPAVILAFAAGPIRGPGARVSRAEVLLLVVYLVFSMQSMIRTLSKNYFM